MPSTIAATVDADLEALRAEVDAALANHPPHERPGLATGWVIVAEYMDENGKKWLARCDSSEMTQWLREGMLWDALNSDDWESEDT